MANDTVNQDEDETDGSPPQKKRLPRVALIAAVAALSGAGVVFALPAPTPHTEVLPPPARAVAQVQIQHPDLIDLQCNPRTQAGKAYLHAAFYFVYTVRADREAAAFESIVANWDRAHSNVLLLLRGRTLTELQGDNGHGVLAKDLVDELDATLFPGRRADKVARVTEILWNKWMVQ